MPGQPNHWKSIDRLQPERAETRPPEDMLNSYWPSSCRLIVTGSRLLTTIKRRESPDAAMSSSVLDAS